LRPSINRTLFKASHRGKIRKIMSALFNHAMRYEWMDRNPITNVRTSAKRLRETDVLTPAEFAALLPELKLRERTMMILAGSTGLLRSELVALTWSDIDLELMLVNVRRSCVRNRFGDTKTEASSQTGPAPSVLLGRNAVHSASTACRRRSNSNDALTTIILSRPSAARWTSRIGWHGF
jgi:hypothetical protein